MVEHGAGDIAQVVRSLDDAGYAVASLELVEPSLDDVFIAKTGRRLEGEADASDDDAATGDAPAAVGEAADDDDLVGASR
jgi:hypothetical protein